MFQIIYNIITATFFAMWSIILTVITGKLSKVSPYHFDKQSEDNSFFNICNDKFKKINYPSNVSENCKIAIIRDFIDHLTEDKNFASNVNTVKFPIFNGKEIIGNSNLHSVISKSLNEYIK